MSLVRAHMQSQEADACSPGCWSHCAQTLRVPLLCRLQHVVYSVLVPSGPGRAGQVVMDCLLKHGEQHCAERGSGSRLDGPASVLSQYANLRPTSGVQCAQPTTASGPRWPPSGRTSLRMRMGYAWGNLTTLHRPSPPYAGVGAGGPPPPLACAHFFCSHWVWGARHGPLRLSACPCESCCAHRQQEWGARQHAADPALPLLMSGSRSLLSYSRAFSHEGFLACVWGSGDVPSAHVSVLCRLPCRISGWKETCP